MKQCYFHLRIRWEHLNSIISPVTDNDFVIIQKSDAHWAIELSGWFALGAERIQAYTIESEELNAMIIKIANHYSVKSVHSDSTRDRKSVV